MKKKVLIIVLAAVIFLGAAFAAFKIYSNQKEMTDEIVELLFKGESVSQFQIDNMLEGEYDIGEKYLKIKDTEKFRTRIYEEVKAFLEEHSDAANFDYVHEKLALVESEGLLNDEALQLIKDYEVKAAKEYAEKLNTAIESNSYEDVAKAIQWLAEKDLFEISGADIDSVLNSLMENCYIYCVKNNTGAYYDTVELRSSSSYKNEGVSWMDPIGYTSRSYSEKSYGDLCVGTAHSTTHYEALEGYDFESKYNTSSTSKTLYLRGMEVNGYFWTDTLNWAVEDGAKYLICFENERDGDEVDLDGIMLLSDEKIYPMAYYASENSLVSIEGDFSEYVATAKQIYSEKYSQERELEKAQQFLDNKQYAEAMNILQYYTHLEDGLENIYNIAVTCMREGETELALEILEHIPYFDMIQGLELDYMIEHLDGRFDPDVNNEEYTKQFLRFLMDVVGPMNEADITSALSGKRFTDLPMDTREFKEDGTGYYKKKSSGYTINFQWSVQDGKLYILNDGNGKANVYDVYNVLPGYYLLTYTTEYSSNVFMTLLKAK